MTSIWDRTVTIGVHATSSGTVAHAYRDGVRGPLCGASDVGRAVAWGLDLTPGEAWDRFRALAVTVRTGCSGCQQAVGGLVERATA